jgi:hypothetical protein
MKFLKRPIVEEGAGRVTIRKKPATCGGSG